MLELLDLLALLFALAVQVFNLFHQLSLQVVDHVGKFFHLRGTHSCFVLLVWRLLSRWVRPLVVLLDRLERTYISWWLVHRGCFEIFRHFRLLQLQLFYLRNQPRLHISYLQIHCSLLISSVCLQLGDKSLHLLKARFSFKPESLNNFERVSIVGPELFNFLVGVSCWQQLIGLYWDLNLFVYVLSSRPLLK